MKNLHTSFIIRNGNYVILRRRGFAMPRRNVQRAEHRTPTPWSECPTSVDLLLDLDLEVLEADAIATLDEIE